MVESKHTPGPWVVGQHPAVSTGWIVRPVLFGGRVRVLPECEGGHVLLRDEANARLIAAAPDLLEAMKGIEHFSDAVAFRDDPLSKALREWIAAGRAAIAKAEGK